MSLEPFSVAEGSITEAGIYDEDGVIVFGVSVETGDPFRTLVLQIDTPESEQRRDGWGMYAEVDDEAAYGAVDEFDFDERSGVLRIGLRASALPRARLFLVPLAAALGPEGRALLARMVQVFEAYPR